MRGEIRGRRKWFCRHYYVPIPVVLVLLVPTDRYRLTITSAISRGDDTDRAAEARVGNEKVLRYYESPSGQHRI